MTPDRKQLTQLLSTSLPVVPSLLADRILASDWLADALEEAFWLGFKAAEGASDAQE